VETCSSIDNLLSRDEFSFVKGVRFPISLFRFPRTEFLGDPVVFHE